MNRSEIRETFRAENPEITERVVTDAVLNAWMLRADKEICAITHCILSNTAETFTAVVNTQYYDLEANIDKFFDVDDLPGGGVYFNNKPLKKATPAEMNFVLRTWKTSASGTPKKWWRRGKYLWFDRAPSAASTIAVDTVYISNDFDSDAKTPYNSLGHLEPFHDGILKYLQWRAKQKIGKPDEAKIAKDDYTSYTKWMNSKVREYNNAAILMRPRARNYSQNI